MKTNPRAEHKLLNNCNVIMSSWQVKRHKFQTFVPKLAQFTTILLIFGTMNNI